MGRFSETWQHPGIYNLIDRSSNLLSTCSRVLIQTPRVLIQAPRLAHAQNVAGDPKWASELVSYRAYSRHSLTGGALPLSRTAEPEPYL
jgi:hypothetical protein